MGVVAPNSRAAHIGAMGPDVKGIDSFKVWPHMTPIAEENQGQRVLVQERPTPIAEENQGQPCVLVQQQPTPIAEENQGQPRVLVHERPTPIVEENQGQPCVLVQEQPDPGEAEAESAANTTVQTPRSPLQVQDAAWQVTASFKMLIGQEQDAISPFSPPLHPVKDFHAPRTDLTKEEFTLAGVGITISMTDGEPSKIITAVQGGASAAGLCECDELVAINGLDVSSAEFNGFDCVELCQQAVRDGGRLTVSLGVVDFCSMQLKKVHVEVSGGCPAIRHLRERNSPAHRTAAPVSPNSLGGSPRRVPSSTMYTHSGSILHASWDDRTYNSRTSSHHSEDWDDDVILHATPRSGTISRTHSRDRVPSGGISSTAEGENAEAAGWTWSVPGLRFWKIVALVVLVGLGAAMYMQRVGKVGKEEMLSRVLSSIDWLEALLQTLPLCPCTYWIRGSIVTVPLCRVCKMKVLRYHNYNNHAGVALDKRGKGLCDLRPSWLLGKCRRSTETIKYLGTFGAYEECEAACLSYNVGRFVFLCVHCLCYACVLGIVCAGMCWKSVTARTRARSQRGAIVGDDVF